MALKKEIVGVWLLLVQDVLDWQAAVNMVMNPQIPQKARKCLRRLSNY
jgi:hypothetical protein